MAVSGMAVPVVKAHAKGSSCRRIWDFGEGSWLSKQLLRVKVLSDKLIWFLHHTQEVEPTGH